MDYELITKLHPKINCRQDSSPATITFSGEQRIYFSSGAIERFKLKVGDYISFVRSNKIWYFFPGKDVNAFKLWMPDRKQNAVCICSKNLNVMFLTDIKKTGRVRCLLQDTTAEFKGNKLIELLPLSNSK